MNENLSGNLGSFDIDNFAKDASQIEFGGII